MALGSSNPEDLIADMRDAQTVSEQRQAARSMLTCCKSANTSEKLVELGVVEVLLTKLSEWEDERAKVGCVNTIWMLLLLCETTPQELVDAGALEPLVKSLRLLGDVDSSDAALILWNMISTNPEVGQAIRDVPGVMNTLYANKDQDTYGYIKNLLKVLESLSPTPSGRLTKAASVPENDADS